MFATQLIRKSALNGRAQMLARTAPMTTAVKTGYEEYWMPFTHGRKFKAQPRLFHGAEGMHYFLEDGSKVVDGAAGLWCVNAGHKQKKIADAVKAQVDKLDFCSSFNIGHELPFQFSRKLLELVPNRGFGHVFFTVCGSSAVDSAMKIALAYHKAKGNASRTRFIGRERGYHGVGFGGISVGGISANRKAFAGSLLGNVDHLPHTHSIKDMAFSKGQPKWGAHLADELERLVTLHDASTIAAVIVEPVAGSTGVIPPPEGYLERLREICTKHDILLIFDEVITGFGRLGSSFGTEKFDVTPDIITCAKGLTNAVVPCGAVICNSKLYQALADNADSDKGATIELFHGYTYSGHPLAMAAGLATLEVYEEQKLFANANNLAPYFQEAIHSLKGLPNVVDIRNLGLMGAVELSPVPGEPFKRVIDVFERAFDKGVFVRGSGVNIAISPPLIVNKIQIDQIFNTLGEAIVESAKYM